MKTDDTLPIWKPRRDTRIDLPELCFMHGGSAGMYLPEHEHSEVQLEVHFLAGFGGKQHRAARSPSFSKLIP